LNSAAQGLDNLFHVHIRMVLNDNVHIM